MNRNSLRINPVPQAHKDFEGTKNEITTKRRDTPTDNEILREKGFLIWANQPYGRDNYIETFSLPESKNQTRYERYTDFCDQCGAPNARLRTVILPLQGTVDWLSGYTCQQCFDSGKVYDYIAKLENAKCAQDEEYLDLINELEDPDRKVRLDPVEEEIIKNRLEELEKNQEVRDKLKERFQRVRLSRKVCLISKYGQGVNHDCNICGHDNSYLCIVEGHGDGNVKMLDEIAGYFCADCITTGRLRTYMSKALREYIQFRKEREDIYVKKTTFRNKPCYTDEAIQESLNGFTPIFQIGNKLEVQETVYKRNAELMEKARLTYEGTPVKIVIRTARESDTCALCGRVCGQDHKCRDD